MRDLVVFDLDGTLIDHDSFARLVRDYILTSPQLAIMGVARKLGLVSRAGFAEAAHRRFRLTFADPAFLARLVEDIAAAARPDRLALVATWRARGATTVLLSASPHDYVQALGTQLGFDRAFGSTWVDGSYRHLHGVHKLEFLDREFPAGSWRRRFAMADQPSDLPLLSAFEQVEHVTS